ncbi:hypothetical protein SBC1_43160 (plasmid) [Caballeronia sp. SBC1]|uniref:hypothetical protein n=1 Tax=unclassified Caballeronia TaxID=2646786 RepID=UPI0013E0F0B1|nr:MULTISPECIES: hypothetical protein [unclassified Caballeronia]QIE26407.1 hypothetical protein SBC2_44770 [Caballeronia sp. SBC2]QIN64276.1 hypothetical protein SBC1_43160 [Caballeronia sp. SBC1]
MSKHTELPSETDGTDADLNPDADPALARTPVRFGRLALWIASASALAIGIMGTVAYGVWFNQDQHAYAEAMEHARQTLWLAAPTPAPESTPAVLQTASSTPSAALSSDYVAAPLASSRPVTVASADLNAPASSTQFDHRAAPSDSAAPKLAVTRPLRASCSASVERHRPVTRVKSNRNVFTRVGSFFHRVSYRQHGTESQRDIYAHP